MVNIAPADRFSWRVARLAGNVIYKLTSHHIRGSNRPQLKVKAGSDKPGLLGLRKRDIPETHLPRRQVRCAQVVIAWLKAASTLVRKIGLADLR